MLAGMDYRRRRIQNRVNVPQGNVHAMNTEQMIAFNQTYAPILDKELEQAKISKQKTDYIASIFLTGTKALYGNWKGVVDINLIEKWAASLKLTGLTGIMFHNCFSEQQIKSFVEYPVIFVKVSIPPNHMSGLWRFVIYNQFLYKFGDRIGGIFFTDSTDLDVLKNPFIQKEYEKDKIYIGNEIANKNHPRAIAGTKWMLTASVGYPEYVNLVNNDQKFAIRPLLNAGLVGGDVEAIRPFIKRMAEDCGRMYNCAEVQDMTIINYLAYEFKDTVVFNDYVNTKFNAYEQDNKVAWFRHK